MSGFDSARAAEYDKTAKKSIIGYEALYEIVMAVLAGHPKERVLVLGAGTGKEAILLKQLFADVEVVAVDPSEPMLDVARAKIEAAGLEIDVRCGRLEDFEDLTGLDAVVMIGVLHHLSGPPEQKALLTRLKSCLRPNGLLILGCHVGPLSDPIREPTTSKLPSAGSRLGKSQRSILATLASGCPKRGFGITNGSFNLCFLRSGVAWVARSNRPRPRFKTA